MWTSVRVADFLPKIGVIYKDIIMKLRERLWRKLCLGSHITGIWIFKQPADITHICWLYIWKNVNVAQTTILELQTFVSFYTVYIGKCVRYISTVIT